MCPLCLSQTRTCTYDPHTNTVPLLAHLTPETPEPREGQMVDAGWGLVCEPVRCRLRTGIITRERGVSRRFGDCMLLHVWLPDSGIPCQPSLLFNVLLCPTLSFWQPQRSYHCYWFLPALLLPIRAGGPQRGVRLRPYWSRLWERGATTPGNMRNALEHRREGATARDTVELQTLLVMCFLETFTALPQELTTAVDEHNRRHTHPNSTCANLDKTPQVTASASELIGSSDLLPPQVLDSGVKMCFFSLCFGLSSFFPLHYHLS